MVLCQIWPKVHAHHFVVLDEPYIIQSIDGIDAAPSEIDGTTSMNLSLWLSLEVSHLALRAFRDPQMSMQCQSYSTTGRISCCAAHHRSSSTVCSRLILAGWRERALRRSRRDSLSDRGAWWSETDMGHAVLTLLGGLSAVKDFRLRFRCSAEIQQRLGRLEHGRSQCGKPKRPDNCRYAHRDKCLKMELMRPPAYAR